MRIAGIWHCACCSRATSFLLSREVAQQFSEGPANGLHFSQIVRCEIRSDLGRALSLPADLHHPTTFPSSRIGALMIFCMDSPVVVAAFTPSKTVACRTFEKP